MRSSVPYLEQSSNSAHYDIEGRGCVSESVMMAKIAAITMILIIHFGMNRGHSLGKCFR